MTRHRPGLTSQQAAVWSFAITGGVALGVVVVIVSPAAFIALCIAVMLAVGFR